MQVWDITLLEQVALVVNVQFLLRLKGDFTQAQFPFQALLVNLFAQATPQLSVNLKHRTHQVISFFPKVFLISICHNKRYISGNKRAPAMLALGIVLVFCVENRL